MALDEELGMLRVPFAGSSRVFGGIIVRCAFVVRRGGDAH
jgi:hypothetical protein